MLNQEGYVDLEGDAPQGVVDLTTSLTPQITDEKELRTAVQKADYALGEASPGQEAIYSTFFLGQQDRLGKLAQAEASMRNRTQFRQEADAVIKTAMAEGRSLSEEEAFYLAVLQERTPPRPEIALEQRFSERLTEEVFSKDLEQIEAFTSRGRDVADETSSFLTKQQIALKIFEETKRKYDAQSWGSWGVDLAKNMLPGYNWYKMVDRVEGTVTDSLWTGTNIEQQMRSLYLQNPDEFETNLRSAVESLSNDNLISAMAFANYAVSFSGSDAALENLFLATEVLDVMPAAAILGAGAVGTARSALRSKLKTVVDETKNRHLDATDTAVLRGTASEGAEEAVKAELRNAGLVDAGTKPERIAADLSKSGYGIGDAESYLRSAGSLTKEQQRRIRESLERNKSILQSNLMPGQNTHVIRLSEEATEKGLALARAEQARLYPHLEDHVLEVRPVREAEQVFGGVDYIEVFYGRKDGGAFESAEAAMAYAKNFLKVEGDALQPVQKGDSWYLRMERFVDETSLDLADLRVQSGYAAPDTWSSRFVDYLRSPEDVRGRMTNAWAKQATFGGQATAQRIAEVAQKVGSLGKNEANRLRDVMTDAQFAMRTVIDPDTGQPVTVQGVFYKTQSELEEAYRKKGYSLPSEKESEAYWTYRQLMGYDLTQRNIAVYRDKARQGISQFSVNWIQEAEGKKSKIASPFFEGRERKELPQGEFSIAFLNDETGKARFTLSNQQNGWYKSVQELLAKDYKIIQVYDPNNRALKEMVGSKGEPVEFLIVRDRTEKPLSMNQVPAAEGGHWMYPQTGGYVKQPRTHKTGFGRTIYDGDLTVHYLNRGADAKTTAKSYETARRMYLADDPNFAAFVTRNLPYSPSDLKKKFDNKEFDPNTPFVATESGQRAADVIKIDGLYDPQTTPNSLQAKVSGAFAQERDMRLSSVMNVGTEQNPTFKLYGAPVLDPTKAMSRGLADLTKSRYFDDYVHQTAENLITQFGEVFDAPTAALRADPMRFIREPVWKKDADPSVLAAAKNLRRNLLYLLGQDTTDMGIMKTFKQKTIDAVLKPYGKDSSLLDRWRWTKDADPAQVARSAVFDLYLGLLNPLQFPLQAQGVSLVAAIDGSVTRAAQGNFLYWSARMRGMSSTNPGAQSLFGKATARALGLPGDVVEEAYQSFLQSGMSVFGGAYNRLDDFVNPTMFSPQGGLGSILDGGRFFFKEGNLVHQGTAFMTSYLRWKQSPGNSLKKPTQRDMAQIIDRASLYYNDMTRASSNAIMAGSALSVPTQFTAFHRNLMESLLGSRLTAAEKFRVTAMYSVMYGLPVGNPISLALAPIWPVSESIRQYMMENGIDTDSTPFQNFIVNGAIQAGLEMATGTNYDTERYAPGGLDWLKDAVSGDILEVIQGPSGVGLGRVLETTAPFARALMGVFTDESDDFYSLTQSDFIDAARNIASVNNAVKAYYAVTTGELMTKSDALQMRMPEADWVDGFMIGALGLTPQEVTDAYLMIASNKSADEAKAALTQEALTQFRRAIKASVGNNPEEAETFFKNAKAILLGSGLTPLETANVWRRAMRENEDLVDSISQNFAIRDPAKRLQRYQQQLQER